MRTHHYVLELEGRRPPIRFATAEHAANVAAKAGAEVIAVFPCAHVDTFTYRGGSPYVTVEECAGCGETWRRHRKPTATDLRVMADAGRRAG